MIVENIVILALEDKVEKMTYKVKGDIYQEQYDKKKIKMMGVGGPTSK